jgi:hypothetical protein
MAKAMPPIPMARFNLLKEGSFICVRKLRKSTMSVSAHRGRHPFHFRVASSFDERLYGQFLKRCISKEMFMRFKNNEGLVSVSNCERMHFSRGKIECKVFAEFCLANALICETRLQTGNNKRKEKQEAAAASVCNSTQVC